MKGLLLAGLMSLGYFIVITIVFRFARPRARAAAMVQLHLISIPIFLAVHRVLPADLGLLPPQLVERQPLLDLGVGLFVYSSIFFGGILQLYNLADRGLSLRILIDILESTDGDLTVAEIRRSYGGGQGIGWMYEKRIQGLIEGGFVGLEAARVRNRPKGHLVAKVFGALRSFVNLDEEPVWPKFCWQVCGSSYF